MNHLVRKRSIHAGYRGFYQWSPKPRAQGSSPCTPAKWESVENLMFSTLFSLYFLFSNTFPKNIQGLIRVIHCSTNYFNYIASTFGNRFIHKL